MTAGPTREWSEAGGSVDVKDEGVRVKRNKVAIIGALAIVMTCAMAVAPSFAAGPGTPFTWGNNAFGQLGNGTATAHPSPAPVNNITGAIDIAAGREHALALMPDGTVRTWGRNNLGQIGDGSTANRLSPVPVPGLSGVIDIASGHNHCLALLSDGTVRAWGYNATGQIGDGSTTNRRSPVAVSGLTSVVAIAGGRDMSYALRSDGTVWAWGLNSDGEIGDGTTTTRTTPVKVNTLVSAVAIAGGRDHGLALLADGSVWSWGDNAYGQLGDGTVVDKRSPVQVSGLSNVVAVAAGAHHSLALRADGTVASWGRNNLGQLGDGTLTGRRNAATIPGLTGVVSIGGGRDHGLAILDDGTVRAWGRNDFGQLGDGTSTDRRSPVPVNGLSGVIDVHGGAEYTLALVADGPPDTDPPTAPGQPIGASNTPGSIALTWAAADDDVSSTLTYRIFRDGVQAGSISSSSATVAFTDTGLLPGSVHTYTITALDGASNESAPSAVSDEITVLSGPTAIFTDDFSSGTLANWTTATGFTSTPPTEASRRRAPGRPRPVSSRRWRRPSAELPEPLRQLARQRLSEDGLDRAPAPADSASGPVGRVLVNDSGVLSVRSDVSGTTRASGVSLGIGLARTRGMHDGGCRGVWDLYRDGTRIVTGWIANSGTANIGRIELGNPNPGTWTANVDDVRVDQAPG